MLDNIAPSAPAAGNRSLIEGPVGTTLLRFSLPIMASTALQSLNGSINAIWIGRFLGEEALTASANGNLILFLMVAFAFGLAISATVLIGQALGRGDLDEARRIVGAAVCAVAGLSLGLLLVAWWAAPAILHLLAVPGSAYDLALAYLRPLLFSLPPTMLLVAIMQALRGAGDSLTPMLFLMLSSLLDTALNPVLILGLGAAPELGIAGSGLATVVASTISLFLLVFYTYLRDLPLRLHGPALRYLRADAGRIWAMARMGVPAGLQMIVTSSSALVMLGLINREGARVTAAYAAMQQVWTYIQIPALSLGAAASAMTAQNIGAGRWGRVGRITIAALLFNLVLTNLLIVIITLIDLQVLAFFLGESSPALMIGRHIHRLATWGFFFSGASMVVFGVMRGNGAVLTPLLVLIVTMYAIRVGGALLFHPLFGATALWVAFPVSSVVAAMMAAGLYAHGGWRRPSVAGGIGTHQYIEGALAGAEPGGSLQPRG
jgi:putative MATE family efflux protein